MITVMCIVFIVLAIAISVVEIGVIVNQTIVRKIKRRRFEKQQREDFINKTGVYSYLNKNK